MTKRQVALVEDALQDALMFNKNSLSEVADLVISQMKYHTDEDGWLCHVAPADVDIGFCYNFDIGGSVCFSFGKELAKYQAKITKLEQNSQHQIQKEQTVKMKSISTSDSE